MSNGKMITVMGGNTTSFYNGESVDEENVISVNTQEMDNRKANIDAAIERELSEAKKIKDKMRSSEIVPNGDYILVRPYAKNPYQTLEINNGGLVIPNWNGSFKNPDTGEKDEEKSLITVANVIEVGPKVKYVREGDDIYYTKPSSVPVPFFHQGLEVVSEMRVMVIINEGVKARMEEINNG